MIRSRSRRAVSAANLRSLFAAISRSSISLTRVFPSILNNDAGQSAFVTLAPRAEAGAGQVVRWLCPDAPAPDSGQKITAAVRSRHEATFVAERLRELGPSAFGAAAWSEIAILCPRKKWLVDLQQQLDDAGLPAQLHSSDERQDEGTAAAWLTALVWVAAHPEDSFEVAGVLREIFGVSDHAMAVYTAGEGDRLRLDQPLPPAVDPVGHALQLLRNTCVLATRAPLHQAVAHLLEDTRLRERLHLISESAARVDREFDALLAFIAERSAQGITLADLARELRLQLRQGGAPEEEIRDAIQLLTSHKAKGLEWRIVIVPFIFRNIEFKSAAFPRLVLDPEGREMIVRDKSDYQAQAEDFITARERQQLQRLLYVVSTRARETLVLIDDEALYSSQKKRAGWSSGELLDFTGANRETWESLPAELAPSPAISSVVPTPEEPATVPIPVTAENLHAALARAKAFPHRVTPHRLLAPRHAPEVEPALAFEQEEASPSPRHPGILYGIWWHQLMENLPWSQPERWPEIFATALAVSPNPDRSRGEWDLFMLRSSLSAWLRTPGKLIQIELPFLCPEADGTLLEGIMDLAAFDPADSTWRIIDWKTNRIGPDGTAALVDLYRGQLLAYVRALNAMLSMPVRGTLYFTQSGETVDVAI